MADANLTRPKYSDTVGCFFLCLTWQIELGTSQLKLFREAIEQVADSGQEKLKQLLDSENDDPETPWLHDVGDAANDMAMESGTLHSNMQACLAVAIVSHAEAILSILFKDVDPENPLTGGVGAKIATFEQVTQIKLESPEGFPSLQVARAFADIFKHRDGRLNEKSTQTLKDNLKDSQYKIGDEIKYSNEDFDSLISGVDLFCKALHDATVDYLDSLKAE